MEPFVVPNQVLTLANCRLSLNTAWLVMHTPYLRHLRKMADTWELPCITHEAESLPPSTFSLSTQLLALVYIQ